MFEGTEPNLRQAYLLSNERPDLEALSLLPTILVPEFESDDEGTFGVLGYMDEPSINPQVSKPILAFPAKALLAAGVISERWNKRTAWNVLEGDPFRALIKYSRVPSVPKPEKGLVAVMMPAKTLSVRPSRVRRSGRGIIVAGWMK